MTRIQVVTAEGERWYYKPIEDLPELLIHCIDTEAPPSLTNVDELIEQITAWAMDKPHVLRFVFNRGDASALISVRLSRWESKDIKLEASQRLKSWQYASRVELHNASVYSLAEATNALTLYREVIDFLALLDSEFSGSIGEVVPCAS